MSESDKIIEAAARFAQQQQHQPMEQPIIQPQPCPITIQLAGTQGHDGKKYLLFIVHHLTGQSVYHIDVETAPTLGQSIIDAAQVARTGLEIPRM